MAQKPWIAFVLGGVLLVPFLAGADENQGKFSMVVNPEVMAYIDGRRIGMTPLLNEVLSAGEHRLTLLLIRPNGSRLRADYRLVIRKDRETMAVLDLASEAPAEGELPVLAPTPLPPTVAAPSRPPVGRSELASVVAPPSPPFPSAVASAPTVSVPTSAAPSAPVPPVAPVAPAAAASPESERETHGLSREMVREGLEAMRPAVVRCMAGRSGLVEVKMTIMPHGGLQDVEAQGDYQGTTIGGCIARELPEEAFFPIYVGDPISVRYPYCIAPE